MDVHSLRAGRRPSRIVAALVAALLAASCDQPQARETAAKPAAPRLAGNDDRCTSQADYETLKAQAFRQAASVRSAVAPALDALARRAAVRVERPSVRTRDDALNVTFCEGRMVIDLPPGVADAFSGDTRLFADVGYAVQVTTDGARRLYQVEGTEPIAYRLAAIGLRSEPQLAQAAPQSEPVLLAASPRSAATPPAPPPLEPAAAPGPAAPPQQRPPQEARPRSPAPAVAQVREAPSAARPAPTQRTVARAQPSFDCRAARTWRDKMVCYDERLAALDRDMVPFYRAAVANTGGEIRAFLVSSDRDFELRRARCRSAACLASAYKARIAEIERIAALERDPADARSPAR